MDDTVVFLLIELFKPKIMRALYQTSLQDRDDLMQELNCKLIVELRKYDLAATPGFWEIQNTIEGN